MITNQGINGLLEINYRLHAIMNLKTTSFIQDLNQESSSRRKPRFRV